MLVSNVQNWLTKSKIFAIFLVSFLVGIFLAPLVVFDEFSFYVLLGAFILLVIIAILFKKESIVVVLAISFAITVLGIAYYGSYQEKNIPKNLPFGESVNFVGVIVAEPDIRADKIKLTIGVIEQDSNKAISNQKILVNVARYPEYKYGDKLKISGSLEKPGVFDDFDYGAYLERYQIYALINNATNVEYVGGGYGSKINSAMYWLKNKFKIAIEKSLPEPLASLAEGLVVGAKGSFSNSLKEEMQKTGTTHIVVISGQNMEIIARVFTALTQYWPRFLSFGTGVIGLLLFTILTGASPSVVRAAILASLFLFARLVGRRKNIFNPLVFTGFIMVLINPFILRFDVGFQLSFMAMVGLIFVSPVFDRWMIKWPAFIREALSATLGAQVATLPIILFNFGRLAILAPITNALVLAMVPYAMAAGFFVGLLGMIWLPLGQLTGWLAWPILKYIISIIEIVAKIPWVSVNLNFHHWGWMAGYYLFLFLLIIFVNKKRRQVSLSS